MIVEPAATVAQKFTTPCRKDAFKGRFVAGVMENEMTVASSAEATPNGPDWARGVMVVLTVVMWCIVVVAGCVDTLRVEAAWAVALVVACVVALVVACVVALVLACVLACVVALLVACVVALVIACVVDLTGALAPRT